MFGLIWSCVHTVSVQKDPRVNPGGQTSEICELCFVELPKKLCAVVCLWALSLLRLMGGSEGNIWNELLCVWGDLKEGHVTDSVRYNGEI